MSIQSRITRGIGFGAVSVSMLGLGGAITRLKRWTGAAWEAKTLKYWNGSTFATKTLKRWDGSGWV